MNATRARLSGHSAGLRPRNKSGVGAEIRARARLEVVVFFLLVFLLVIVVVVLVEIFVFLLVLELVVLLRVEGFFFIVVVTVRAADRVLFPLLRAVIAFHVELPHKRRGLRLLTATSGKSATGKYGGRHSPSTEKAWSARTPGASEKADRPMSECPLGLARRRQFFGSH